eukprot:scaffold266552_cov43-Prasinocladus_malaysianus.AAC.3
MATHLETHPVGLSRCLPLASPARAAGWPANKEQRSVCPFFVSSPVTGGPVASFTLPLLVSSPASAGASAPVPSGRLSMHTNSSDLLH